MVAQAQEELKVDFTRDTMTERIFAGKLMEIKGRTLVETRGRGRMGVQIRANEELGQMMTGEPVEARPKTTPSKTPGTPTKPKKSHSPVPKSTAAPKEHGGAERARRHRHPDSARNHSGDGNSDRDLGHGDRGERGHGRPLESLWASLRGLQARLRGEEPSEAILASAEQEAHAPVSLRTLPELAHDNGTTSTTMNSTTRPNRLQEEVDAMWNTTQKPIRPTLARRLARAAAMTMTLMQPLQSLVGAVTPQVDIMEVACSPNSTMTTTFQEQGYTGLRINYRTGYDLDTKKGTEYLREEIKKTAPRLVWVSMVCTRMSVLQNLTERTPEQMDKFLKRRGQDFRRCDEVVSGLEVALQQGGDIAWEWPTTAVTGWRSKPLQRLQKIMKKQGRQIYWVIVDGCQYGFEWQGQPVKKSWTILTTSREMWLTVNKRCDRTHEHVHCRGRVAEASSFYPVKLCRDVWKAMRKRWEHDQRSLENSAEIYLLNQQQADHEHVLAISRTRMTSEDPPTGKKLEQIKQMMLRVHRASGHSGMSNLVELLRARGAPTWALEIARNLKCPECEEAAKPTPRLCASMGESPGAFEVLGTDCFEYEDEPNKVKMKFILRRDRATGLTMIDYLHTYQSGGWEPSTEAVIKSLVKWQMVYPTPRWILADAGRYYTGVAFLEYLHRGGVGLTIAPAEAHWLMGSEESAIGVAKATVNRLRREGSQLAVPELFSLAAAAMKRIQRFSVGIWIRWWSLGRRADAGRHRPREGIRWSGQGKREGQAGVPQQAGFSTLLAAGECGWSTTLTVPSRSDGHAMATTGTTGEGQGRTDRPGPADPHGGDDCMAGEWSDSHPGEGQPDSTGIQERGDVGYP